MNKILLDALENCVQRLEQGETLESALSRYPLLADQLRPLLEAATLARSAGREPISLTLLPRQRARGLALAAELRQVKNRRHLPHLAWRPAMIILSVIAVLVMSSNGLLYASAHSLPGDTLYPLKRSVESTRLQLVTNPVKKQALEKEFDQRRLNETKSLITEERVESVQFTGLVGSQSKSEWLVSGIPVIIGTQTDIDDGIQVGDDVQVQGVTTASGNVETTRLSLVAHPVNEEYHPDISPTASLSLESSGESDQQESSSGQTISPSEPGDHASRTGEGEARTSETSHGSHPSEEAHQPSPSDSGARGD